MITTSILKKVVMAVTGLAWFGFLVTHLSANFLLYVGPATFNAYPENLQKLGFLLYVAEAGLVVLLLGHVFGALRVTLENRKARGSGYAVRRNAGKSSLASRTMIVGGTILLIFLVTHVKQFKYGDWTMANGLWGLVATSFQSPLIVAWYVVAMIALGLHLSHGLGSAFQTLGVVRPTWRAKLKMAGFGLGWLMTLGFMSIPVYFLLTGRAN